MRASAVFASCVLLLALSCGPDGRNPEHSSSAGQGARRPATSQAPAGAAESVTSAADPKDRSPGPALLPDGASPASTPGAPPQFSSQTSRIDADRLRYSWRRGCPVPVSDLRLLSLHYWGFDDEVHTGELVVHRDQASRVTSVMRNLYEHRFPIDKMQIVDEYQGDDDKSMEANNTSAFNCREVEGRPGVWSQHAYGRALDINPVQNPYVSASGAISPPAGAPYADRSKRLKGMIHSNDRVVTGFRSAGWKWGGDWSGAKDYQHFSLSGQ